MGALLGSVIRVLLQVLAGVGVGHVLDKVAADKVPNYESPLKDVTPWRAEFKPMKLVFTIVAFVLGSIVLAFIAKKFKIRILK